tara:strand:- start:278 stop:652 length:375 start_codon:yes stop_codon:yes gene_type:complete
MRMAEIIKLPFVPPSPNITLREHWSVRSKRRNQYQLIVRSEMNKWKFDKAEPKQPFNLEIETIRRRKLDHDNLYGSMKSLIDALCNELFIWDDDTIHLTSLKVNQKTCKEVGEREEYTLVRRTG